jgi:hypothetical protein
MPRVSYTLLDTYVTSESVRDVRWFRRKLQDVTVIKEERWTSGVASSQRKIYQLEVLYVQSGIIVISVITVGNAVQINRSRLSSVYLNYLSRIPGHAASWCQNNLRHCTLVPEGP